MVQYFFLGVPKRRFGSHPCRVVSSSYQKMVHCHGRGREFESRRPRHFLSKANEKFSILSPVAQQRKRFVFRHFSRTPGSEYLPVCRQSGSQVAGLYFVGREPAIKIST